MSFRSGPSARPFLLIASLSVLVAAGATACAEDVWAPVGETQCALRGWARDANPRGLSVRAAPSPGAQVVGALPPYLEETKEGYAFGVLLSITGSRDGWVRITDARDDPSYTGERARPTYRGVGWIPGAAVGIRVQSSSGYTRPDASSSKIVDLVGDSLSEMGKVDRVVACSDEWALVEFTLHSRRDPTTERLDEVPDHARRRQRAWFRRICGAQETTCEGMTD